MVWDYVLVGAGSAGCVLAARLTEDPSIRVLLLEAGDRDTAREIEVPAAFSKLFRGRHDWSYTTQPEPGCDGRALYWPRGKVLGGSSSINAMIYIRGARADYDGWRDAGCEGWGFDDVLPYFIRSEDNSRGADDFHGVGGPLPVADLRSPSPLVADYLDACEQTGLARNPDFNAARQEGVGQYQVTQRKGRRASTAEAFLRPAMKRPNLEVRTYAHATRVVFDGGRAVGVEADLGGRREVFRAAREVVLCGGAVNTPQLLLLSGIGPAAELRALGIDVVVDAPNVGRNLQDHVAVGTVFHANAPISYFDADKRPAVIARWLLGRRGPFSSNIAEAGGFVRTRADLPGPDLQLLFAPAMFVEHGAGEVPGHGYSLGPYLLTPQSRGTISLRSADPLAAPAIRPNYLSEQVDVDVLVQGLQLTLDTASRRPLRRHSGGRFLPEVGADDDRALRAYVRARAETIYHPTSTAAMGASDDAVCDPQLRVRGVDGLRVVDASVLPTVPRGNTNAPVIMVSEKAADLLREVPAPPRQRTAQDTPDRSAAS
jgi:choline dehydrogenase